MNTHPTKLIEIFAGKALRRYYANSVSEGITNSDYEGEVKDKSSILNILTFGAIASHAYTGADMTADDLTESNAQLVTDQAKYFYFTVKSWNKFRSYIKSPEGTILDQVANELKRLVDYFILSNFYTDVQAGQRIGTSYTTGTVAIDANGVVTGSGTTFTSAMVGRGFKASGHSVWYRVKQRNSATEIVIEKDVDDSTATYDGGVIGAGATFEIEAVTAKQVTKDTVLAEFTTMSDLLDEAEVSEEDRWAVVSPSVKSLIVKSPEYDNDTESAREEAVKRGYVGMFAGFKIYKASSQRLPGNSTDGWHILAGHKSAIVYALGLTENGIEPAIGNFGQRYKSLYVYGAKVPDERRKALVELFAKL